MLKLARCSAARWWDVITLATVGYGDVYLITPVGRLVGSVIIFLGLMLLAVPTGIFASGFVGELEGKKSRVVCPHCERYVDEEPDRQEQAPAEVNASGTITEIRNCDFEKE